MQAPETELKFPVYDMGALRTAAERLGFQLRTERSFEGNTLYDTPDRALRQKKQLLRLREYSGHTVLTHKRVQEGHDDSRYKIRIETETLIEDGDAMAEVFHQLGYEPVFRYEKFRTEWDAPEGAHLVLDETPIGIWAELEGPTEWIDRTLQQLGVQHSACTTESYGMLFLRWKEATGSEASHLTFAEAQGVSLTDPVPATA